MITAVQNYNTSFNGLKKLKSQKITRQVIRVENRVPEGLTKISRNELGDTAHYILLGAGSMLLSASMLCGTALALTEKDLKGKDFMFMGGLVTLPAFGIVRIFQELFDSD